MILRAAAVMLHQWIGVEWCLVEPRIQRDRTEVSAPRPAFLRTASEEADVFQRREERMPSFRIRYRFLPARPRIFI